MAVRRHKSKATGKVTWSYCFDAPGSSRLDRKQIALYGFAGKKAAQDAEAQRRIDVQHEHAAALRGAPAPPTSLSALIGEFIREHAARNLAPKTVERYREMAAYLSPTLLATALPDVTSLLLTREWKAVTLDAGDSCFVMMPFAAPLGNYYEKVYKPAIEKAGLKPVRADAEIFGTGKIMDQVLTPPKSWLPR